MKTYYFNTSKFFDMARLARLDGTYHKLLKRLEQAPLVILDDFGLTPIDQEARATMLDVITIETSRSLMELLDAFADFKYPNDIGPGVYDIHSPRVPSTEEMVNLPDRRQV